MGGSIGHRYHPTLMIEGALWQGDVVVILTLKFFSGMLRTFRRILWLLTILQSHFCEDLYFLCRHRKKLRSIWAIGGRWWVIFHTKQVKGDAYKLYGIIQHEMQNNNGAKK